MSAFEWFMVKYPISILFVVALVGKCRDMLIAYSGYRHVYLTSTMSWIWSVRFQMFQLSSFYYISSQVWRKSNFAVVIAYWYAMYPLYTAQRFWIIIVCIFWWKFIENNTVPAWWLHKVVDNKYRKIIFIKDYNKCNAFFYLYCLRNKAQYYGDGWRRRSKSLNINHAKTLKNYNWSTWLFACFLVYV